MCGDGDGVRKKGYICRGGEGGMNKGVEFDKGWVVGVTWKRVGGREGRQKTSR